jgi:hypothetical protein
VPARDWRKHFTLPRCGKGDREKALATLQKSFDAGFCDFAAIDAAPYFSSLRADSRFEKLIRQTPPVIARRHRVLYDKRHAREGDCL